MSYVGNTPTQQAFTPAIQYFSGNGSTTAFTLSRPVASVAQVQAVIENVPQNPGSAFTVSGNTITFTSAPPTGTNNIYVYYTSPITQVAALPQSPQVFGNLQMSTPGGDIVGDFTNATLLNRNMFQTSTNNGSTGIYALPNGTSTAASWQATNNSDPTNASKVLIATNGSTDVQLVSGRNGTGTYLPLTFYTNGSEQMRLDTAGNLGIGTNSPVVRLDVNTAGSSVRFGDKTTVSNDISIYYRTTGITRQDIGSGGIFTWGISGAAENMRLDSSGNLLVGTTTPVTTERLNVTSGQGSGVLVVNRTDNIDSNLRDMVLFRRASTGVGSISCSNTATSYNTSSDYRLKENIAPMTGALATVAQLKPVTYTWKADGSAGQGFIAHELQEVVPDCVTGEKDAVDADENPVYQGIDTSFLVATLTAAIQEQQALIQSLTARIEALENK